MRRTYILMMLFAVSAVLVPSSGYCETNALSGAIVMNQTAGARQLGMGDAFTAVADDVNTLSYNPAGLANLGKVEASFTNFWGLDGMSSQFVGGSLPVGTLFTFAGSAAMLNSGKVLVNTTNDDGSIATEDEEIDGLQEMLVTFGLGRDIGKSLSAGAAFKLLQSTIAGEYSTSGFAFDAGMLYRVLYQELTEFTVGVSYMNKRLSGKIKYLPDTPDDYADEMPTTVRAGAMFLQRWGGYYGDSNSIMLALDGLLPSDSAFMVNTGLEGKFDIKTAKLALRAGMKYNYGPYLLAFSGGLGLEVKSLNVDLSFCPMAYLGTVFRVSVSMKLGGGESKEEGDWYWE